MVGKLFCGYIGNKKGRNTTRRNLIITNSIL
jgi:hypothetical protein